MDENKIETILMSFFRFFILVFSVVGNAICSILYCMHDTYFNENQLKKVMVSVFLLIVKYMTIYSKDKFE